MSLHVRFFAILSIAIYFSIFGSALSLENESSASPEIPKAVVPTPEAGDEATKKVKPRKAKRGEVKETEGTSAPERFEGNTILKSQYYLDGQSLEVDPD
jgi:hypothetical protein